MVVRGHIQGGVIVADEPALLPEGAAVRIDILADMADPAPNSTAKTRQGAVGKGRWSSPMTSMNCLPTWPRHSG